MSFRRTQTWGAVALLTAVLGTIYLVTIATQYVTNDAQTTALTSWRIAQTGTPWLDGYDYERWGERNPLWVGVAENGHIVGFRSPGPIAAGIPVYAVLNVLGFDGYSIAAGSATAALLTTAAMALTFLALRGQAGTGLAAGGALALGLTTPVWSVSADSLWPHAVTLLGIAGMAWACMRERWWLVGLFGGVALWGRLHTALIVAVLGVALALVRQRPRIALEAGLVSGLGLLSVTLWTRWMYGTWSAAGGYSVSGYAERALGSADVVDRLVNHLGLWVAPDRGILVWTPVLLVLAPAVWRSRRDMPDWSRWLAIGGIAYTLVQGQLNGFSGGTGFYGYRLTLELLLCLVPAYVFSVPRAGRFARNLLGPVLGLQFAAISIGALGEGALLSESAAWTDNSFVRALTVAPILVVWPALTVLLGWLAGYAVQRRLEANTRNSGGESTSSDVGARNKLDRV